MSNIEVSSTALRRLRAQVPLVHNITNYVVMNWTANVLLAIGASPVMAHAAEEVEEMAAMSGALVINIGTLSTPWIHSMQVAMKAAKKAKRPIIFDPVGAGATKLRTELSRNFLAEFSPDVVRGNASEISALAEVAVVRTTKGVDSTLDSPAALVAAQKISQRFGSVVCVSGAIDYVVSKDACIAVENGDPLMSRVTGMGCAASALIGAFAAIDAPAPAALHAMLAMGVAGEMAARDGAGSGTFQWKFLDALFVLSDEQIAERKKLRV